MNKVELIQSLISDLDKLPKEPDESAEKVFRGRTKMAIRKIFGDDSHYLKDLEEICLTFPYFPLGLVSDIDPEGVMRTEIDYEMETRRDQQKAWNSGKLEIHGLLNNMLEDLKFTHSSLNICGGVERKNESSNRVFVVHGHDEGMKESVARALERLDIKPIILNEMPDRGMTIIEKFEKYAPLVDFAVVLISPDDIAYSKSQPSENSKPRARQNVIFELGYFIGKLGRPHVLLLCQDDEVEFPSDYYGVLYTPYDKKSGWKFKLADELKECGYKIDKNRL